MRLAVFTNVFPARVSTFFARDMRALLEAGVEVDIFPIYPLDPELWRYVPEILDESAFPRKKVHHLSLGKCLVPRPLPLRSAGRFLKDSEAILASAARFGLDSFAKSSYILPKAWTWAKEYGGRYDHVLGYWGNYAATCAYLFHRLTAPEKPFSIWVHAGTDLYKGGAYLREKLLYADNIVTCCDFNIGFLQSNYADIWQAISGKVHVCAHGLDFAEFPFTPDGRERNKILAVGRLSKWKGFDILLKAAGELKSRKIEFELEFIGDGEDAPALKALASSLGIKRQVKFHGWQPFREVRRAMEKATLLVHPSSELGDGVPNVIKEAVALGTPVIASDVAGIAELLDSGRCGFLVTPKDVHELSEKIETLLADASLRREFAQAARGRAEQRFDLWRNGRTLAERLKSTTRIAH
ncbi:MAG: glycosyltransferase family 4 protein [Armatimonadota bacterium]